jgi:hypothetical protein
MDKMLALASLANILSDSKAVGMGTAGDSNKTKKMTTDVVST